MRNIFYACTTIFVAIWVVCFFVLHAPVLIHALLLIALLSLILSVVDVKQIEE